MTYEIEVLRDGSILLDGEPSDLARIEEVLTKADASEDGIVYSREDAELDPPPVAQDVMQLIAAHGLPVGFRLPVPAGSLRVLTPDGQQHVIILPPPSPALQEFAENLPPLFAGEGAGQRLAVFAPELSDTPSLKLLARELPYTWALVATALQGHDVTIACELLTGYDALIVDSAVTPALPDGWVARAGGKAHVYLREQAGLMEVVESRYAPYYHQAQPVDEASYAHCLLTVLASGRGEAVRIAAGEPLPALAALTDDPRELDWVAGLRFVVPELDAGAVVQALIALSQGTGEGWTFAPRLVTERGESRPRFEFERPGRDVLLVRCVS